MPHTFTREELYELVWSEPVIKLAARYSLSDVGFAKACKKGNIPRPPRGYWNKLVVGKKVTRMQLPPRGICMSDEITIGAGRFYYPKIDDQVLLNNELSQPPEFLQSLSDVHEVVEKLVSGIIFPKSLKRPHRLLQKLLEEDECRKQYCLGENWVLERERPRFDSRFEQRRLRLINALFTGASLLGFNPDIRTKTAGALLIKVNDTRVSFSIDPPNKENWEDYDRIPITQDNPKMRFEITFCSLSEEYRGTWDDTDKTKLENMLPAIFQQIIFSAEIQYRQDLVERYERLKEYKAYLEEKEHQRIEAEIRAEIERQKALEQARIDKLLADAENFRKARDIRRYVSEVLKEVKSNEVDDWAKWAEEQANSIDPVRMKTYLAHE